MLVLRLLFGSGGGAFVLVWERDEVVFGSETRIFGQGERGM